MEVPACKGGTYESATTGRFSKSCMGVVRVVTSESNAFVRAMVANDGVEDRKKLFELAALAHVANAYVNV